ncbi:MAG: hypothetical protein IKT73_00400, partial [Anaerotignum sp.]|nr:hypothetical protein [Anaerotignum sp.]
DPLIRVGLFLVKSGENQPSFYMEVNLFIGFIFHVNGGDLRSKSIRKAKPYEWLLTEILFSLLNRKIMPKTQWQKDGGN